MKTEAEGVAKKMKFVIVGSGWRARSYVRIAKALPEKFALCAMLCRTKEKADKMAEELDIYTTTSILECREMTPDFVVVAVSKASIAQVSMEWMSYGFTVLCETPASLEVSVLEALWEAHKRGGRLVVAEQYTKRPLYGAMLSVVKSGLLGEPDCVNLSLAHEYHGARLLREFLQEKVGTAFAVAAKTYFFKTVETLSRYERFTDGRTADKKRTVATFEFADGKVAWYDFDSEQYRSPIRKNYVKIQGCKGELINNNVFYLDDNFLPRQGELTATEQIIRTESENPNLQTIREVEQVTFKQDKKETILYEAPFGLCRLKEDDVAVTKLMMEAAEYTKACKDAMLAVGKGRAKEILEKQEEELKEALQDCYMAILMKQAADTGKTVASTKQVWQE